MFKYVALLFCVGLVFAEEEFRWDTIPVAANASQCIYRPELRILACRGPNGIVEAPAVLELSRLGSLKFDVFGLRRDEVESHMVPVELSRYELFPRKMDNITYLNSTLLIEKQPVGLFLYFGEKASEAGIRITDRKSFLRLIDVVFNVSTAEHVVKLESQGEVSLFGEILIADKPANKRWLGFGFPWMGLGMGWGWGLGWGLPLFGLGLWG